MTNPFIPVVNPEQKQWMKRLFLMLALCISVSVIVIGPFFVIGEHEGSGCCGGTLPVTHDLVMHLNQMRGFHDGLRAGRLYPRWQENTNQGFGAPTTLFYPPFIYYVTSAIYFLTGDWMTVIKGVYLLLMIASGIAMFRLGQRFYSDGPALVAMCVYLVTPYHLLNHYQRGALAECLAFTWMPLTLVFVVDLMRGGGADRRRVFRGIAALAVTWALFIWSHPPTAYQFLLIGGPLLLGFSIATRRLSSLTLVVAALLLGFVLSAGYLLPAIVEQGYIHADDVERSWPYHESYILNLSSTKYDHRNDDFVVRLDRVWLFGLTGVLILGLALELSHRSRAREGLSADKTFRLWFVGALYASFMMLAASRGVAALIPKIEIGVFAWRMLAITSLALALLFGHLAAMFVVETRVRRRRILAGAVLSLAGLGVLSVSFAWIVLPMYRAQAFVANPDHSNYSLVPRAGGRDSLPRPEVTVNGGHGKYAIERWEPEYRLIRLDLEHSGTVSIRTFNFPGWMSSTTTGPIEIRTGSVGEIVIDLSAGRHVVGLEFTATRIRRLASIISVLGTVAVLIILGLAFRTQYGRMTLSDGG